jgi:GTPase SAR1 family protein
MALIVFDVTQSRTFQNVEKWLGVVRSHFAHEIRVLLIGNKADLTKP